jgi:AAA15 family ATPase/GTPase
MDYESTGIVKLIQLFDLFSLAMNGMIVFIDEIDSNINDVYFCKLVEFFTLYGKGQLCFTTHNTSPMSVLKSKKNSIDFLSSDNMLIPWKKNGNFAPENLYRHGMIERLPFNIEPEDFLGILGD